MSGIGPGFRRYLLASDFDQTLSFNDSGQILSEMLGITDFNRRVRQLSAMNMVQQGGELAYMILHDSDFKQVRVHHLREVGKKIRLKANIKKLYEILTSGIGGRIFEFFVISAAPEEVIKSALEDIVPPEHIFGTKFEYDQNSGEVLGIKRVSAGYGKVAVLNELKTERQISQDHIVYVGDGSSDIHVMLDVNHHRGLTIAVSESRHIAHIARRTVLSDDTLCVMVPILEEILRFDSRQVMEFMEVNGMAVQEWSRGRTDWITFQQDEPHILGLGQNMI